MVLHVQDVYPESLINNMPLAKTLNSMLLLPVDIYILHNSHKIIAISPSVKNHLVKTREIENEKISVIFNWQEEESFLEFNLQSGSINTDTDMFTFMYLCNIGPVAGVDLLIDGFSKAVHLDS